MLPASPPQQPQKPDQPPQEAQGLLINIMPFLMSDKSIFFCYQVLRLDDFYELNCAKMAVILYFYDLQRIYERLASDPLSIARQEKSVVWTGDIISSMGQPHTHRTATRSMEQPRNMGQQPSIRDHRGKQLKPRTAEQTQDQQHKGQPRGDKSRNPLGQITKHLVDIQQQEPTEVPIQPNKDSVETENQNPIRFQLKLKLYPQAPLTY